jgi:hypothetical protein
MRASTAAIAGRPLGGESPPPDRAADESDSQPVPPQKIYAPATGYQEAARQARLQGVVILRTGVGADIEVYYNLTVKFTPK